MKALATLSAIVIICLSPAVANAAEADGVTLYGRLNVSLERVGTSAGAASASVRGLRETNNRSVLGLRGGEDLGGGLRALFQIEGSLSLDTGAGSLASRDTRVGLAGGFGTLFMGHWSTPYSQSTSVLDPFYPTTAGYMAILGNGAAPSADNTSDTASFDRRQRNTVGYESPRWRGLSVRGAHGVGEERPAGGARPALTSLAALYDGGRWYVTFAHEFHHDYQGAGLDDSGTKLAAAYRFGGTRLAGIVEELRYETATGPLTSRHYYLAVTHQHGRHALRLGVARAADGGGASTQTIGAVRSGADTGATHATLGYDYTLSSRSGIYVYNTRLVNDRNGAHDFAINALGAGTGATLTATVVGMRHSF